MSIHDPAQQARWRGTTYGDDRGVAVSFERADGSIVRLTIDPVSALHVRDTLNEYLTPPRETAARAGHAAVLGTLNRLLEEVRQRHGATPA